VVQEPTIILSLPGQWPSRSEIVAAIVQHAGGLVFAGQVLFDPATNHGYQLTVAEHDPELVRAFALAGRGSLSDADLAAIQAHTLTIAVAGAGGSLERARELLDIGARLLRAGGLAIKVESTGVAHSISDWQALAAAAEPAALYHAYVTLIGAQDCFFSCGMHNLGLPDASVPRTLPPNEAAQLLETFLLYLVLEQPVFKSGETFSLDAQSPRYRLRHDLDGEYGAGSPFHNPYGMWRLE
jgi:hypothetical protein